MSDSKDTGEKKLTLGGKGRLELKKSVGTGQVRQSFSHGRSKTVQVEVKRKRRFDRTDGDARSGAAGEDVPSFSEGLSDEERLARVRALEGAAKEEERRKRELEESERRAEEARKKREEEAKRQAEEEARRKTEEEEAAQAAPGAAEEARKPSKPAKVEKAREEEPAPIPMTEEEALAAAQAAKARAAKEKSRDTDEDEEKASRARDKERKEQEKRATMRLKGEPRRRQGKLNVTQIMEDGEDEAPRGRSLAALRRAREKERLQAQAHRERNEKVVREVVVPEAITVGDLANRMAERAADVIKSLMKMGVMATVNQSIDQDTAELVIEEFGHRIRRISESDVEDALLDTGEEKEVGRVPRPPVVTVMGHVDHGKTSLLDALRATDVAAGEAGGITQHIGAYQVKLSSGEQITFLDTPGHEAFTSMRMRGAKVTDIVVLVVAADDGLQPQTREAISHAKAAGVPMIVAINKIDKPEADPLRVKNQLLEESIVIEDLGGDVQCIEVSAKERLNLDKLEEAILLQAEILELKANPDRRAKGAIIEAKLEKGRGSVATVLIQTGTLHVGDVFVAGAEWGRVRALIDDKGRQIESAGPSAPVEVLGLQGTPQAGDDFAVLEDEAKVREISDYRQRKQKEQSHALAARGTLEQMFNQIKAGEIKELPVVVKTDVQGSLEALTAALQKIGTDEVKVRVLHGAVGGITESDVTLAASTGGIVIGFNVRANPQARDMARRDGVDIRYYSIIYDVIDDAKSIMGGLLAPEEREKFLGYAQIREVFNVTKVGKIAGCMVTDGMVKRGAKVRLLRDDVVIYEGALKQLKRFKDDVREVQSGYECGMAFENYDDIKQGDVVECFEVEEIAREL